MTAPRSAASYARPVRARCTRATWASGWEAMKAYRSTSSSVDRASVLPRVISTPTRLPEGARTSGRNGPVRSVT